ncbi:MAG: hypothetical protein QXG91_03275 [Candidatus Aenigmatarchaeota archaeon]
MVKIGKKLKEWGKKIEEKISVKCVWPACKKPGKPTPFGFLCEDHFNKAKSMAEEKPKEFSEFKEKFLSKQPALTSSKILVLPIVLIILISIIAFLRGLFFNIVTLALIIIALIGIITAFMFLYNKFPSSRPIFSFIFIILIIIAAFLLFQNITDILKMRIPGIGKISDNFCMASCIITNFISPDVWYSAGGIGKYCREVVCRKVETIKLGCVDCFLLETKVQRQNIIPYSIGSISINIKAGGDREYCIKVAGQKICDIVPPAKNVYLSAHSNDFLFTTAFGTKCEYKEEEEGRLYECKLENLEIDQLPKEYIFRFDSTCKSPLKWKYKFRYSYNTTGFVSVNIIGKDFKQRPTAFESTSTPGPLAIGVKAIEKTLMKGIDEIVPLTIGFANKGRGDIYISKVSLRTLGIGSEKLRIFNCKPFDLSGGGELPRKIYLERGRDYFIDCVLDISNVDVGEKEQKTLTFLVNAIYDVVLENDGDSIYVDTIHYDCAVIPENWYFSICSKKEQTCINNNEDCFSNNKCENVISYKENFPFIANYYEEKCKDGCSVYLRKEIITRENIFLNISIEDKDENFISKITCKLPSGEIVNVDEKTIDENCPCIKTNIITKECEKYKYNKCIQISPTGTDAPKPIACKADITTSTRIDINSK